ncbi:Rhomboid-domain-containing protein [Pyrenophora tritici-repentis]|nr:Rhomboid-domain-containing protein [Pyrenophora tritici-repentis]
MSLLRPTCALARRLCTTQPQLEQPYKSGLLALLQRHRSLRPQCRSFTSTPHYRAKVIDTPQHPVIPQSRKRTVRIGSLPEGPVQDQTIQRIFGRRLSAQDGNNVLRILHHRRTAGSLADYGVDNLGKQFTHVNRELALKGLEWLREKYPIDEARAAEEWAEKEANRIAYELWLADPETESKYKDPARAFREQQEKEEKERLQQEADNRKIGILHAGKSQFELNIEEKRRQRLEEITRKAEEKEREERAMEEKLATGEWVRTPTGTQLMKPGQETYVDVFGREQVSRRKEIMEKYRQESVTTKAKTPEELLAETTLLQRLYPMTAFVLFTVILSWGFAHYYIPPDPSWRLFPDLAPSTATVAALVAANLVVAGLWRVVPLWPLMTRFFMHVPGYPRAVQSILNVFSHQQYEHLLANMMMLSLVGFACCDLVGRGVFMGTYISAGAVGTLASLYWANVGKGNITSFSVGASAAIWGVAALYCLLTDQDTIKLPVPKDAEVTFWPKMLFAAFLVLELISASKKRVSTVDHASHFGGMFVGISTAGYLRATGWHGRKGGGAG